MAGGPGWLTGTFSTHLPQPWRRQCQAAALFASAVGSVSLSILTDGRTKWGDPALLLSAAEASLQRHGRCVDSSSGLTHTARRGDEPQFPSNNLSVIPGSVNHAQAPRPTA